MPKPKHRPVRTCVACREEAGKGELIRIVRRPDGGVAMDVTGRAAGRGAYLHASAECIELARKKRSLDRALGAPVQADVWSELLPRPSP
ncbi:MAG: YlxR family protein [Chloroflexi bacterium]|nr:MAG: YlxR family protein [Chloroflexota bacterium]